MGLDAALDRFWEAADARRLGIDAVQVVAGNGPGGERRRIDDIRRDVFSVSKTVTSLAVGMLEGDGALSLDDPVLARSPGWTCATSWCPAGSATLRGGLSPARAADRGHGGAAPGAENLRLRR